ncbi:MAG: hypothetical protein IT293_05145 [Deltaproteobacteria bacterium]|nr:hypothetical protein [Deltaproteobacteria bacterium]
MRPSLPHVLLAAAVLLLAPLAAQAAERRVPEPHTTTIRIRLKGPTLRVRCRGGDCAVSVVGQGASMAVSVTRTREGEPPFTFARTLEGARNIAIETGIGTDSVEVRDLAIPGFLRVATGVGDDTLDVENVSTARKVSIDSGDGSDVVQLTTVSFGGKVRFFGQAGDDDVTLTDGRFASKVGLNGGQGIDGLVFTGDSFTEPPVVQSFER